MRIKLVIISLIIPLISFLLSGCLASDTTNNISSEQYNQVVNQLKITQQQFNIAQSQANELRNEVSNLKNSIEFEGETPTETANNIVKRYHETHIYSAYDFFVCSDMALDVWDMLKAQNINAVIEVGNVKNKIGSITDADHAWVLAEVKPSVYLALEATGGFSVNDNPLYYSGWSFSNPKKFKRFEELKKEYNFRVDSINQMINLSNSSRQSFQAESDKAQLIVSQLQSMSINNPNLSSTLTKLVDESIKCGEYKGKIEQLDYLLNFQKQQLENIVSEMKGLIN
jgi:hypothetical protein